MYVCQSNKKCMFESHYLNKRNIFIDKNVTCERQSDDCRRLVLIDEGRDDAGDSGEAVAKDEQCFTPDSVQHKVGELRWKVIMN